MSKITAFLATALVLASASAQAAPRLSGEAKLAREIEGRVAGEPVRCLPFHRIHSSRIIDDTAIVYDTGSTIYVNRPRAGQDSLDSWDTLVTRTFGSQLCSTDVVHLYDAGSRMETGVVFLGEFVPYRKAKGQRAD
ncbi:MAG TPA: hypothetical protein VGB04_04830 [Allosphingosinicella sp.]